MRNRNVGQGASSEALTAACDLHDQARLELLVAAVVMIAAGIAQHPRHAHLVVAAEVRVPMNPQRGLPLLYQRVKRVDEEPVQL